MKPITIIITLGSIAMSIANETTIQVIYLNEKCPSKSPLAKRIFLFNDKLQQKQRESSRIT